MFLLISEFRIEYCGQVVSISDSYSRDSGSKSRPENRLFCYVFHGISHSFHADAGIIPQIRPDRFLSYLF
jgi:hypothetical protein